MRQFKRFSSGVISAAIVVAVFAACAGSSTVSTPDVQSSSSSPSTTVITSTTSPSSVSAKSTDGTTVTVNLPVASARAAVTETLTATAPSGYAVSRSLRGGLFAERNALAGTPGALLYIVLTSTTPVTFDGPPSVTVVYPPVVAGDAYYLAGLSASGATTFTEGPGSISGTTISFGALLAAPGIQITPTDPLVIEFYTPSSGSPAPASSSSPLPAASASPSPAPVVATPASLTFASTASASQSFTVTQANNAGAAFNTSISPAGVVSVGQTAPGTFSVSPAGVGTATITISGNGGESTTVTATVQTVPITVSSTKRGR